MSGARGFTLLEIVVALAIAGLLALAARAALVAGLDTQDRVRAHVAVTEGEARFRALVVQALRHMTDAPDAGIAPFVVRDTITETGAPSHVLEFYSRGFGASAGSGRAALVRVAPAAGDRLTISLHDGGAISWSGTATGIHALRARMRTTAGEWVDSWPATLQVPAAVALELRSARTGVQPVPLVAATRLEDRP
jgi:prepilin-type N-terminal cleavage/methylation domain-containing protein